MTKTCTICKIEQPIENFAFKNTSRGIRSSNCKACQKVMKDRHYERNKKKYYERNVKRKKEKRQWWLDLKAGLECGRCGNNHPAVIDFHHRDPTQKEFTISSVYKQFGEQRIRLELEKCDVLCSNCHRVLHWEMDHSSSG